MTSMRKMALQLQLLSAYKMSRHPSLNTDIRGVSHTLSSGLLTPSESSCVGRKVKALALKPSSSSKCSSPLDFRETWEENNKK